MSSAMRSTVTLHVVASLDGFIAKKDNSISWMDSPDDVYEKGVTGGMRKSATANGTSHRSSHLLGMGVVSGCRLRGQQLSLILPSVVYKQ